MVVGHSGWSRSAHGRAVRRRPPDAGTGEPPQPHPLEAVMGLEVSKPHLDLLALVARSVELGGAHQCAGKIASIFIDVARDLAREHVRTTLRFEWACVAVALGRQVSQHVVIANAAGCLEQLAGGADVDVALSIE